MKKFLSVILALALIMICSASIADEGGTRTSFWIPKNLADIEVEDLPVSEFPTVKTKTANGTINVYVDPTPDALYANWMGYGEEREAVQLENGQGQISQAGHKYQLGAGYVNDWWKDWIAGVDYIEGDEASSYKDAVAYINHAYAQEIADGAMVEDEPFHGYYVYYIRNVYYFVDYDDGSTELIDVGDQVWEQVTDYYPTEAEARVVADELGGMSFSHEESEEYHATVYTTVGYDVIREGGYAWLYNVEYGHSRGWPNRAYSLVTGEYIVDYTRAGVPNYASRITEGKDYFETGIQGATTTVNWEIGKKKNRILSIKTVYPEGSDIASITLRYPDRGTIFYHYTITYNTGDGEQYVATYSARDELIKAYYLKDGKKVAANSSATKWINCETQREEHSLLPLNGDLLGHPAHVTAK